MESLKLSDQEKRIYAELFGALDVENTGKVNGKKATELFLTSGLTQDVLHQILEVCGAKRLGHFGRIQFYIALKLIAAAQNGIPVSLESLNSGHDIPLPAFGKRVDSEIRRTQIVHNNQNIEQDYHADRMINVQGVAPGTHGSNLPPPPKMNRQVSSSGTGASVIPGYDSHVQQPESPPLSPDGVVVAPVQRLEVIGKQQSAPATVMTNQYNQTYVNNQYNTPSKDKAWASFDDDSQGLLTEEAKENQWAHFSDHNRGADTSSISSETESVDDVWSITDEQREYYVNQFKTMQPDLKGLISGGTAKEFFEKSRLPVTELSKIWQLSDVDRDGALSIDEFCIAMHLVVLRRNDVDLPDHLPPALLPYTPLVNVNPEEPFAADLPPGSTLKRLTPSPQAHLQDSKIIHPVAVRMSPDGHPMSLEMEKGRSFSGEATGPHGRLLPPPAGQAQNDQHSVILMNQNQGPPAERPMALPLGIDEGAPTPPPRKSGHSRSSSLDNQLLDLDESKGQKAPPRIPPRPKEHSIASSFVPYHSGLGDPGAQAANADQRPLTPPGGFNQKHSGSRDELNRDDPKTKPQKMQLLPRQGSHDKRDLQALVRKQRERNTVLTRLNQELNEELQEVMEQRIALEIQLGHLRPYSS